MGSRSYLTGVLIRSRNWDKKDTEDACTHTQEEENVRTERAVCQAKEREVRRKQTCPHLDLEDPAFKP